MELYGSLGLAMTFKDFLHIQNYFRKEEDRDPSMTEIRVLDTYWLIIAATRRFQQNLRMFLLARAITGSHRRYL